MKKAIFRDTQNHPIRFTLFAVIHLAAVFAYPLCVSLLAGHDSWLNTSVASLAYYLIIVALPVFGYLWYIKANPWHYLKMTEKAGAGIAWALLAGGLICLIFFFVNGMKINTEADIRRDAMFIAGTVLIGILEEIPFRGLYLQKFSESIGFAWANIVSSLIFAVLHAVVLIKGGGGSVMIQLGLLFVISLWLGYIFKRTQSFWAPAIIHAIYNLAVYFF